MKLCSVQPFSLADAGGGPRILRSLFENAPAEVLGVCTAPRRVSTPDRMPEHHIPARPHLGRVESTRLNRYLGVLELPARRRFRQRLVALIRDEGATAVHVVAHGADFAVAASIAEQLDLPLFLSLHDDLGYALQKRPEMRSAMHELGAAWRRAEARFVISDRMGAEMCRRFGTRPYVLVTDGLTEMATGPRLRRAGRMNAYFMGAFHLSYRANLEAFVAGAARWRMRSGTDTRLVMRSGNLPAVELDPAIPLDLREWGSQDAIDADLAGADLLYLPLPFGEEHERFVRYSLSTKLVTYAGSGVPILFHGPRSSAAGELLGNAGYAAIVDSLDPEEVAAGIGQVAERGEEIAGAALRLAREMFDLDEIRARFWSAVESAARGRVPSQ